MILGRNTVVAEKYRATEEGEPKSIPQAKATKLGIQVWWRSPIFTQLQSFNVQRRFDIHWNIYVLEIATTLEHKIKFIAKMIKIQSSNSGKLSKVYKEVRQT